MLPSELKEEQWIKIAVNPDHIPVGEEASIVGGAIGFHVYYGRLHCFAIDDSQPADDPSQGILITNDPETADEIYLQWDDMPGVLITRS